MPMPLTVVNTRKNSRSFSLREPQQPRRDRAMRRVALHVVDREQRHVLADACVQPLHVEAGTSTSYHKPAAVPIKAEPVGDILPSLPDILAIIVEGFVHELHELHEESNKKTKATL